jgi:hypothetical protein
MRSRARAESVDDYDSSLYYYHQRLATNADGDVEKALTPRLAFSEAVERSGSTVSSWHS